MVNLLDGIGGGQINNPGLWSLNIHQKFLTAEDGRIQMLHLGKQHLHPQARHFSFVTQHSARKEPWITKLCNACVVHFCSYDSQNLSDGESLVIMSNFLNFKINFLKFQFSKIAKVLFIQVLLETFIFS